jgi:NADH-quinone oxidoreductase subunit A
LCAALSLAGHVLGTNPNCGGREFARLRLYLAASPRVPPSLQARGATMSELLSQYMPLVVFIAVAIGLSAALMIAPFLVAYKNPDPEKLSAYECGFNAFDDARMKFDVRFYLVAILFIIFDLEVAFLFPWAIVFGDVGAYGFWSMMVFLAVLTIGFIYEWKKGALEWD